MQYLCKAILHSPRFNGLLPARYHIHLAVILKLPEQRKQTIGNRYSPLGAFAFWLGDDELGMPCSRPALYPLNGLADGQYPFFKVYVLPLKGADYKVILKYVQ